MNVRQMLEMYRGAANPAIDGVVAEFKELSPAEQREFLFRAFMDIATHPTTRTTQNVGPHPAGTA